MIKEIKNKVTRKKEFIDVSRINFNTQFYKPVRNKKKLGLIAGLTTLCLVTPATNWMLVFVSKALTKYPLWLYR